jgi:hypothetical protein
MGNDLEVRMKKALGLGLVALLCALPASAQKLQIDYDKTVDFERYTSFAWAATPETSLREISPLMHSRIKNAIEDEFGKTGLIQVEENPDILITYHTNSQAQLLYDTTSFGYGYGPGWYWGGGLGTSTTSGYSYQRGTLVIDIWDAETKQMVWRGVISGTVKKDPEKNAKQIYKGVKKLAGKWRQMYSGN